MSEGKVFASITNREAFELIKARLTNIEYGQPFFLESLNELSNLLWSLKSSVEEETAKPVEVVP